MSSERSAYASGQLDGARETIYQASPALAWFSYFDPD
jgi:hypothetical protein